MAGKTRYAVIAAIAVMSLVCGCRRAQAPDKSVPAVPAVTTDLGCLLKTYRQDGSCYVTRQKQSIAVGTDYIGVSGTEPEGSYAWQLNMGFFMDSKDVAGAMKWLPAEVSGQEYCRIVLACLQGQPAGATLGAPVRILGNWATPVASAGGITWYRSGSSSQAADIVVMQGPNAWQLVVRGYDYSSTRGGQSLPSKIELYRSADSTADRLLVEVNYIE